MTGCNCVASAVAGGIGAALESSGADVRPDPPTAVLSDEGTDSLRSSAYELAMAHATLRNAAELYDHGRSSRERWRRVLALLESAQCHEGRWRLECVQAASSLITLAAMEDGDLAPPEVCEWLDALIARNAISEAVALARTFVAGFAVTG